MADRYALFATASLHDVQVEEVSVRSGTPLRVGREGQIRLPVPASAPFLVHARWLDAEQVEVTDGQGAVHRLGPDDTVTVKVGPVRLDLALARQFTLRRTYAVPWSGSLAWLLTVVALSLSVAQGEFVWSMRCKWFGIHCAQPQAQHTGVGAEYLTRLLNEDYAGAEEGGEIKEVPNLQRKMPSAFMPAGDPFGPKLEQGGAKEVTPEPNRTPPKERAVAKKSRPKKQEPQIEAEQGTPIKAPEPDPDVPVFDAPNTDGIASEEPAKETELATDPLSEDKEGFGLSDWLDASPEEREIQLALHVAKQRLRIDPNDQEALSLMAYYQYLAEDLPGAEKTYDKLIELHPEEARHYNNKALVYKRRKDYAKEEGLYRVALAIEPGDTTAMNNLAVNLSHQGKHAEALKFMDRLEELLPGDPYSDLHRAKIHAALGDDDAALRYLDKALAGMAALDTLHHIEFRQDIRIDPSFARLRDDPRFRATLVLYYGEDTPLKD